MTTRPTSILYCDFDGVLHAHDVVHVPGQGPHIAGNKSNNQLFEHTGLLSELLAPFPQVEIVLATTWVFFYGLDSSRAQLPPDLERRVIGATFDPTRDNLAFTSVPRGYQILNDVRRRKPKRWLALDDDTREWPSAHKKRLIATDPVLGLSHPSAQAALKAWLESL